VPARQADPAPDEPRLASEVTELQRRNLALLAVVLAAFLVALVVVLSVVR
jgi:hypothetical protein